MRRALDSIRQDLGYAGRTLAASPGFTAVALLSLALGIGATTTIFSVVHAVVIDPFPYKDPDTLLSVNVVGQDGRGNWSSYTTDQFLEIAERARPFDGVIASTISDVALTGTGDPERVRGNVVTMNTFDVMGVPPLLGRTMAPDDAKPDAAPVVVLGWRFWQTRLGARPDIVGQTLTLNGVPRTVIGVMPRRFMWRGADVYLPTVFRRGQEVEGARTVHLMGRLRAGVTTDQAARDLRPIIDDLQRQYPDRFPTPYTIRLTSFSETFRSGLTTALLVLLGAVGLLLLIACVNVSNLLLARASAREREMAMRASLGAGRGRLVRQLFTESTLLAVAGAMLGVLFAWASLMAVLAIIPPNTIPDESHVRLNVPVLLFAAGVAIVSCLVFGLLPAWQTSRADVMTLLREGGRGSSGGARQARFRSAMVAIEVALAVILLVGATLMMRTLMRLQDVELKFQPERVLGMRVPLPDTRYPTREQRVQFLSALLDRVGALPGVRLVAISTGIPVYGGRGSLVEVPGQPTDQRGAMVHESSAGYFAILGTTLRTGRLLDDRDVQTARRAGVVNEAFVRRYFPNGDALGRSVRLVYLTRPPFNQTDASFEILGIIRDQPNRNVSREPWPEVYVPFTVTGTAGNLFVSTVTPPLQLERSIRGQVYALDPQQPVTDVRTLAQLMDEWTYSAPRFNLVLLGCFSVIGLLLATIGVYGVTSYAVSRQRQEIGVRMALGAERADILRLVLTRGLGLVAVGLVLGLLGALGATRALSTQIWGVSAFDPLSFAAVTLSMLLVGVVACLVPALRAARVSPIVALRAD